MNILVLLDLKFGEDLLFFQDDSKFQKLPATRKKLSSHWTLGMAPRDENRRFSPLQPLPVSCRTDPDCHRMSQTCQVWVNDETSKFSVWERNQETEDETCADRCSIHVANPSYSIRCNPKAATGKPLGSGSGAKNSQNECIPSSALTQ